ncbi:hypothetical protein Ancab_028308 [Ancistrocladus abbreviatus]
MNMNRILCQTSPPSKVEQQLTPRQIWDFIEHIGVWEQTSIEDVVRRIGDMEQRDWDTFQEIASKEKQKAVDRELSLSFLLMLFVRTLCGSSYWWSFFDLLVTPEASATLGVSLLGPQFIVGCLVAIFVAVAVEVGFCFVAAVAGPLIAVCLLFFVVAAVVGGFEMWLLLAGVACTLCGRCC